MKHSPHCDKEKDDGFGLIISSLGIVGFAAVCTGAAIWYVLTEPGRRLGEENELFQMRLVCGSVEQILHAHQMLTSRGETIRETRWDMYERVDQLICEAQSFFRSSDAQGMQSEGDVLSLLSRSENIYSQQTDHLFYGTQYDPLTFFDADSYPTLRLDNWKITPLISGELHLVTSNGFFVGDKFVTCKHCLPHPGQDFDVVLEDDRRDLHISRYVGDKDKVEQLFERLELGRPVATGDLVSMVAYDDDRFSRNGKKIRYGIAIQITPEMLASANELWQKVDAAKGALSDDHIGKFCFLEPAQEYHESNGTSGAPIFVNGKVVGANESIIKVPRTGDREEFYRLPYEQQCYYLSVFTPLYEEDFE